MKRKMPRSLSLVLSLVMLASLVLSGCSSSEDTPQQTDAAETENVIKLGVFEPLTGADAGGGQLEYDGMLAAQKARPTVMMDGKEYKIEFVVADNKSDDVESVTAAESLVSQGVAMVLGGSGSSRCIAAAPTFERAEIPAIGSSCTNPLVTQGNEYYFRICFTDNFQGMAVAEYAKNFLGCETAAIVTDVSDTYCVGLRKFFIDSFGEEGIVADVKFNKGDQDFSAQINALIDADADCVFCPSQFTEGALIQVQAKQLGYEPLWLGADCWDNTVMVDIGGDAVNGCQFSTPFVISDEPDEVLTRYLDDYAALFPGEIPKSCGTALGYDAYNVALDAIEIAGCLDGPALKDALMEVTTVGVTGAVVFDEEHDAVKDLVFIKKIEDGELVYCTTFHFGDEING